MQLILVTLEVSNEEKLIVSKEMQSYTRQLIFSTLEVLKEEKSNFSKYIHPQNM